MRYKIQKEKAEKIGAVLKQIREEQNITQAALADKLGASVGTIQYWERGKHINQIFLFLRYLQALNVELPERLPTIK
jgi:transcriptional regulator with XRE-family HTH domain